MKIEDLSEKEIEILKDQILASMPGPMVRGIPITECPAVKEIIKRHSEKKN